MRKLLSIELNKIIPYRTFWIISGLFILILLGVFYITNAITVNATGPAGESPANSIYNFPDVWHYLTFVAHYFHVLSAIIVIILVTNEITFRTIRQNVIDGLTKFEFLAGKFLVIVLLAIFTTLIVGIIGLIYGFIFSADTSSELIFKRSIYLLSFFIQGLGLMSLALLFGIMLKRAGIGMILFIAYIIIIEPILGAIIRANLSRVVADYLPTKVFTKLISNLWLDKASFDPGQLLSSDSSAPVAFVPYVPNFPDMGIAVIYTCVFLLCTYLLLKKRDL